MSTRLVSAAVWILVAVAVLAPRLATAQEGDLSAAPRITIAEFKKLRAQADVVVVDVRGAAAFRAAHIPGARSIPLEQLSAHVDELKREAKPIVTYCA